jgi:hypothetical protein
LCEGRVGLGELRDDRVRPPVSIPLLTKHLAGVADLFAQFIDQLVRHRPVITLAFVRYTTGRFQQHPRPAAVSFVRDCPPLDALSNGVLCDAEVLRGLVHRHPVTGQCSASDLYTLLPHFVGYVTSFAQGSR